MKKGRAPGSKSAQRRPGWKEQAKDKQMKPSLDKDKAVPEEKKRTEEEIKMFIKRYGYDPTT